MRCIRLAVAVVLVALALPAPALADPPSSAKALRDVTGTAAGQDMILASAGRFAQRGVHIDASSYRALRDETGYLVVGAGSAVTLETIDDPQSGKAMSAAVVLAGPVSTAKRAVEDTSSLAAVAPLAALSPSWQYNNYGCLSRYSFARGWMDECWWLYKVANDPSATQDFWALDVAATAHGDGFAIFGGIGQATMTVYPYKGTSPMSWFDWSPKGDTNGSCRTISASVAAKFGSTSVTLPASFTSCETIDITKYTTAGQFTESWVNCTVCFAMIGDREMEFQVSVAVPQGGKPIWGLYQWMY